MAKSFTELSTPPGRFVFGDLYEPNTENFDGKPLTFTTGADAGKSRVEYVVGLAIPKTQAHWGNEPGWGQLIWAAAHAAFPGGEAQRPDFSWKIYDGDQKTLPPKSKSKVPYFEREGWRGCWVLRFVSSYAPEIYDAVTNPDNPTPLTQIGAVRPGYCIQIVGSVGGNENKNNPGVYLNLGAVGLRAYMPEIITGGVDVKGKFGGAVLPGATTIPTRAAAMPAPSAQPAPTGAAPPGVPTATVAPPAAIAPPTAVVPAPSMLGIPTAPAAPAAPPTAPAPPPVSRPPHKGIPIESYFAQGWTIDQLRADGYTG